MKHFYRFFVLVSILCAFTLAQGQSSLAVQKNRRDIALEERLKKLMTKVGVNVDDVSPRSNQPQAYREVKIRWNDSSDTKTKPSISAAQQRQAPVVSLVEDKKRSGTLPRNRSLELSPNQVFIAAVGAANQLRWWSIISDPRVVRAEFQASTGELRSQDYYQSNFTLAVAFPDDPQITNLRFYKPVWTGSDFDLKPLAVVPVR
jgi:hypothetical protein